MEAWGEFWKSCIVILAAMVLLRIAGRKSISQMTIPTTVIMISIGTVIVQPIADQSIWMALVAAATFISILLLLEFMELKWNSFENIMRGRAVTLIREGKLQVKELAKLRMTVDQLEMKLRQTGISRMGDMKTVTMETNGLIGYEYMPDAQPLTYGQMKSLLAQYAAMSGIAQPPALAAEAQAGAVSSGGTADGISPSDMDLFAEISQTGEHHAYPKLD
jgi:uncharacterized membrane protein YcaP (DUF421 family)